jgi:hypothetical protein
MDKNGRQRLGHIFLSLSEIFRAFSASVMKISFPGAMPQAFTFRALGAECKSFCVVGTSES